MEGDTTAISLSLELSTPTFVAVFLLLSDVLAILGNLSRTFQIEGLNLILVEQLITSFLTSLSDLKADPFKGGYLSTLPEMLSTQGISAPLDQESFKMQAQSYIARVIENIKSRFPQVHLLTCLGYFDPCNVEKATPIAILEVREMLSINGHKLWQEFTGYKSHDSCSCRLIMKLCMWALLNFGRTAERFSTSYIRSTS